MKVENNTNKTPKLRFYKEDEYNRKEFGEIASLRKEKHDPKKSDINFPCIELEHLSQETGRLLGSVRSENQKSIKSVFKHGDILFGKLRPYLHKFLKTPFDGVCSTEIWVLKGKLVNNGYLFYLIQSNKFLTEVNQTSGSKMPRADWNYISEIKFSYPSTPEQQKIASFLSTVDKKINLLESKIENLEQYKKGVVQKIFKQEIRFKQDDGCDFPEWEKMTVSNILTQRNEQAPKNDEFPLMSFVADKGVVPKGDRYNREFLVNKSGSKKYKRTRYGDFIYSSNNLETGSIGLNRQGNASISPVYSIFEILESSNIHFISYYFIRKQFINKMLRFRQGVVYGQWKIPEKEFLKIEDQFPSLSEQTKIANFLTKLDQKIELHKEQLEKMQTWKKGLLQKMFA